MEVSSLVGGSPLSATFDLLLKKLNGYLSDQLWNSKEEVRAQMKSWGKPLVKITSFLEYAEEGLVANQLVKLNLDDLRDLAYDIEDILEEFVIDAKRSELIAKSTANTSKGHKVTSSLKSLSRSKATPRREINSMVMNHLNATLQQIETEMHTLWPINLAKSPAAKRLPESSLLEGKVWGRDSDKEAILQRLLEDGGRFKQDFVIPIVGMGGLGKTALARLIYNDKKLEGKFDLKEWVCVSNEFDFAQITRTIIEQVTGSSWTFPTLTVLQKILKEKLSGLKFFLVLDGVWNEEYNKWGVLKRSFMSGAPGSKIIVTTRNKNVGTMMRGDDGVYNLELLQDDACLSLFTWHALGKENFDAHPDLQAVGEKLVKSCKRLPLALKFLGGILRGKLRRDEWENVLNNEIWSSLEYRSGILPSLRLSYNHLPSHLKQCFAYCALFPRDYEFDEKELVLLWMAEGLLQQQPHGKKQIAEEIGHQYFQELLSRSLFQQSSGDKLRFVMHGFINDLAVDVAGEIYCNLERIKCDEKLEKARHLSFIPEYYEISKRFRALGKLKHLRTFLPLTALNYQSCFYLSDTILHDLLPTLNHVRVLSLRNYQVSKLPDSFENLKLIRYIDLSGTTIKCIPESVGSLLFLQTLLLLGCQMLTQLPTTIGNLIDLHHLDITDTPSLKEMPSGIGNLENLLTMPKFIVGKARGLMRLFDLKNLSQLRGRLSILDLQNVLDVQDAREANLHKIHGLEELVLQWTTFDNDRDELVLEMQVLNWLKPHSNLKNLKISWYGGKNFPNWVHDPLLFFKLSSMELSNCKRCTLLPSLGLLPVLKKLIIKGMEAIEAVGSEFYGGHGSFPSLEELVFKNMLNWKEWTSPTRSGDKFPCLRKLVIEYCPKLISMPGWLFQNLESLQELCIYDCPKLISLSMEAFPPSLGALSITGCPHLERQCFEARGDYWTLTHTIPRVAIDGDEVEEEEEDENCTDNEVLKEIPKETEWQAKRIHTVMDELSVLPESPNCPILIELNLQGSRALTALPPLFFVHMTVLQHLDLSHTSIKSLPVSLSKLVALKKLILRHCKLFRELTPQVGDLHNLEEINLDETQIVDLPKEIGKLSKLNFLRVSLYGYMNCEKSLQRDVLIHPGTIANLSELTNLSIDVNPDDKRWKAAVEIVVEEALNLKKLRCLVLYLPNFELLGKITETLMLQDFSFTVGQHKQRIISRVPKEVEAHFQKWNKCLKFVKGEGVPDHIKTVLLSSTALYLDRHATATSLSCFVVEEMQNLKFCILSECNEIQTVIDGRESYESALLKLQFLHIYYMKNLVSIWRTPGYNRRCLSCLKFLALHVCPKLSVIFSPTLLINLYQLEVLIIEDCPEVTSIVSQTGDEIIDDSFYLPSLKRISLICLPELVYISSGFHIAPELEKIGFYGCPKLESLFTREMSGENLEVIRGESEWWEKTKKSNESEWGKERLCRFESIFSHIDKDRDVMTQMKDTVLNNTHAIPHVKKDEEEEEDENCTNEEVLKEIPKGTKWQAKRICTVMDELSVLPESPNCPILIALNLQGSRALTALPPLFFVHMPVLQLLDLSHTSIKSLPESLSKLVALKKLILRHCKLFRELEPHVGDLRNLEEINLHETQIVDLPEEIGKLSKLNFLRVSLYGYMNSEKSLQRDVLIHPGTIANLSELTNLSIDVNPDDKRWKAAVEIFMEEACNLKKLRCLELYLPKFELLGKITNISILQRFSFTVGQHKQRIISRLPKEVEAHFQKWNKCLKFVKGEDVPGQIKRVLLSSTALYLDRHATATSLSCFGVNIMRKLKFCILSECNEIQTVIDGGESYETALLKLQFLHIYYMKNLVSIWRTPGYNQQCLSCLKFLALHMCPRLSVIFSLTLLGNLYQLEVLIIEDCPEVTSIVSPIGDESIDHALYLPSLKRISLICLPELVYISSGFQIAPLLEKIGFYGCPKLESPFTSEMSGENLEVIRGDSEWWEKTKKLNELEWGKERLDRFESIFSHIDKDRDVMTQMKDTVLNNTMNP